MYDFSKTCAPQTRLCQPHFYVHAHDIYFWAGAATHHHTHGQLCHVCDRQLALWRDRARAAVATPAVCMEPTVLSLSLSFFAHLLLAYIPLLYLLGREGHRLLVLNRRVPLGSDVQPVADGGRKAPRGHALLEGQANCVQHRHHKTSAGQPGARPRCDAAERSQ
jgi:hypothetical protein